LEWPWGLAPGAMQPGAEKAASYSAGWVLYSAELLVETFQLPTAK